MIPGSISVSSKNYVFDPRPRFPFRVVAKRYWIGEPSPDTDDHDIYSKTREDVRTLVFVHGVAAHKEHWELTIQRLFEDAQTTPRSVRFRDMWSVDLPNHGDSAILNEEVLDWGYDTFPWDFYARGVHAFLAGLGTGVDVDFSRRRLTLVGHSMGGSALILTPAYHPMLKISSLHLIEPHVVGEKALNFGTRFIGLSAARDDVWPNAESAYHALRVRRTFLDWDESILKILVTYGLRPLPTAEYPDKTQGVTLKCTRRQQAASCNNFRSTGIIYRYFPYMLKRVPTHVIFGAVLDALPYNLRHQVLHVASGGISNFASVTTVPGVGHMMVQTHPNIVADVIWKQLILPDTTSSINGMAAKL